MPTVVNSSAVGDEYTKVCKQIPSTWEVVKGQGTLSLGRDEVAQADS